MKIRFIYVMALFSLLAGCAVGPQTVNVSPMLDFQNMKGVSVPVELVVEDERNTPEVLGYRNAKNEGPITFDESLSKSMGEAIQSAMLAQNVEMERKPEPLSKVKVNIVKLRYSSPNKDWVSRVELEGEVVISLQRGLASMTKRFSANRSQDVATAPTQEFNQKFLNTLLSELFNKAFNDKEVINFLK
ncbi:hypothetical protein NBRC116188_03390 [Oceaniserpentilla sp. 4NH20-0058]|uniref:YajG family lipoprotein n=1 Tax=Oceaniserpentilla sp. 4NH20-0058 TaxID=3127660 RepID=UPI003102F21C